MSIINLTQTTACAKCQPYTTVSVQEASTCIYTLGEDNQYYESFGKAGPTVADPRAKPGHTDAALPGNDQGAGARPLKPSQVPKGDADPAGGAYGSAVPAIGPHEGVPTPGSPSGPHASAVKDPSNPIAGGSGGSSSGTKDPHVPSPQHGSGGSTSAAPSGSATGAGHRNDGNAIGDYTGSASNGFPSCTHLVVPIVVGMLLVCAM